MAAEHSTYYSELPLEQRLNYAREITKEVLEERSRLYSIACAINQSIDRESNIVGAHLVDVLEDYLGDIAQLQRLQSCFIEVNHE